MDSGGDADLGEGIGVDIFGMGFGGWGGGGVGCGLVGRMELVFQERRGELAAKGRHYRRRLGHNQLEARSAHWWEEMSEMSTVGWHSYRYGVNRNEQASWARDEMSTADGRRRIGSTCPGSLEAGGLEGWMGDDGRNDHDLLGDPGGARNGRVGGWARRRGEEETIIGRRKDYERVIIIPNQFVGWLI